MSTSKSSSWSATATKHRVEHSDNVCKSALTLHRLPEQRTGFRPISAQQRLADSAPGSDHGGTAAVISRREPKSSSSESVTNG